MGKVRIINLMSITMQLVLKSSITISWTLSPRFFQF
jgi:hypothetical protein